MRLDAHPSASYSVAASSPPPPPPPPPPPTTTTTTTAHANGTSDLVPPKTPSSRTGNGKARSQPSTNGSNGSSSHLNGSSLNGVPPTLLPDYFGHDREEMVRILIQSLEDLGYRTSATILGRESGFEVESAAVAAFRAAVLEGDWPEAEALLAGVDRNSVDTSVPDHPHRVDRARAQIALADGADEKEMLFAIRQQKYLELLEERDLGTALMVLRQELTPLHQEIGRLHALSSLMMCQSAEDLKSQAEWDGAVGASRPNLWSELSKSISPSVMIPPRRLAVLLDQVKQNQIARCLYHNTTASPSLYADHRCDRIQFPLHVALELDQHQDEVWILRFSPDGSRLATGGRDRRIIVYDVPSFAVVHTLVDQPEGIADLSWSPDSSKLLSCTYRNAAFLWDANTAVRLLKLEHHAQYTACTWAPDGLTFVTGSLDRHTPLCQWTLTGQRVHGWSGNYRVRDCRITGDGRRLVAISFESDIHVYDLRTHEEEYSLAVKVGMTCLSISQDSRYFLVNLVNGEVQMRDIQTAELVQRFLGQKQGTFTIRSVFGGANESFIASGSEDSRIYIWHRENGQLLEALEGHRGGCVNAVAWHPTEPGMFASAGDDHRVRMYVLFRSK